MERVCFDHLSGSPVEPAVMDAMLPWFAMRFAGAGAVHSGGVEARLAMDDAREKTAAFLGAASPEEIIFTSSGSEALNLAVKGCALASPRKGKTIVLSSIEHPAVAQSVEYLESLGYTAKRVGVTIEGKVDPAEIIAAMDDDTILVCAHAGHHDLGTIQDLREIGGAAAENGSEFLLDATYAMGWLEIDVKAIQASYLAAAPHRFGGPKGTGILYKQRRARLAAQLHGGGQELGWRAGTENIPGILGTGAACALAQRELPERRRHAADLQARLWSGLAGRIRDIRLNGPTPGPERLPNSLNLSFKGIEGEGLALSLDLKGFAITSGQACAARAAEIPPVLAALGAPEDFAAGTVILSFGKENTPAEVDRFLEVLPGAVERLRAVS